MIYRILQMDPIKETWHGYPHLYKRGTEKGGAVVPSENAFTLGENMDKVPSKIKTEAAKGCD